jgi:hypothetical protein
MEFLVGKLAMKQALYKFWTNIFLISFLLFFSFKMPSGFVIVLQFQSIHNLWYSLASISKGNL